MEKNSNIAICGTFVRRFGSILRRGVLKLPVTDTEIKTEMFFRNPFAHPTVLMRKDCLDKFQLRYREEYKGAEDYDLWVQMMGRSLKFANIQMPLLKYRVSDWSITGRIFLNEEKLNKRLKLIEEIQKSAIKAFFKDVEYEEVHNLFYRNRFNTEFLDIKDIHKFFLWLKKLIEANHFAGYLDQKVVFSVYKDILYEMCISNSYLGIRLLKEINSFDRYSVLKKAAVLIKFSTGIGHLEIFLRKMYFRRKV